MNKRVPVAAVLAGFVGVAVAQSGVGSSSGDMVSTGWTMTRDGGIV